LSLFIPLSNLSSVASSVYKALDFGLHFAWNERQSYAYFITKVSTGNNSNKNSIILYK
jgi:hypothetical protein